MTIANLTSKVLYNGNDSTTTFALPNTIVNDSDVEVYLRNENVSPVVETLQINPSNYTIVGTDVEMGMPPATGEKLLVRVVKPLTQATDYVSGDSFPATSHEDALDKVTQISQQLNELVNRTPRQLNSSNLSLVLPEPEANKLIGWNAAEDQLENQDPSGTTGPQGPPGNGATKEKFFNVFIIVFRFENCF